MKKTIATLLTVVSMGAMASPFYVEGGLSDTTFDKAGLADEDAQYLTFGADLYPTPDTTMNAYVTKGWSDYFDTDSEEGYVVGGSLRYDF